MSADQAKRAAISNNPIADIDAMSGTAVRSFADQMAELLSGADPDRLALASEVAAAIVASGEAPGLQVGDLAPDFTLADPSAQAVSLRARLEAGPVVLCFYRGEWCPPCNLTLRAYQQRLEEIRNLGATFLAITPQAPSHAQTMQDRHALEFEVLSDLTQEVAAAYRLRYGLPEILATLYREQGLEFGKRNADGTWRLPVSAIFVIDRDGVIRARHVDPNHVARMDPEQALAALRRLR